MIYLYDEDQTDFRYNGRPLPKAYEVITRNFINEEFYVTFKHPIDNKDVYKEITEDLIIKAHTPNGMQPFRLLEPHKEGGYVEFEAWPLLFADLRNKLVKPLELNQVNLQLALNAFKDNLLQDVPFEFYTNITELRDYHTQDVNEKENNPNQLYDALEVLKAIINRWQGELDIDGYSIRIADRIGVDKDALVYEKKNINEYVEDRSIKGIVTRVHGKSDWTERSEDGGEDIEHSIQATVDSSLIDEYSGGIVFEAQYTNNNIRTQEEMENWLKLKFTTENIDKPTRSIELDTNIIGDEEIHQGDGLVLKYLKHDVDMEVRAMGYEYDGFKDRYRKIFLGDVKDSFTITVNNENRDATEDLERQINTVQTHANGKNRIFRGPDKPENGLRSGDLWYKPVGDGEMEVRIYDGTTWGEPVIFTGMNAETKKAIKEAEEEVEKVNEKAQGTIDDINEVVEDNGATSLKDLFARKLSTDDFGTMFYQQSDAIGLTYEEDGQTKAIIVIEEGIPYIKGEHVILDGDTIVDGDFTVTDEIFAKEMSLDKFTTGTLNAAEVNLINVNAQNIVGENANLIRASFNGVSDHLNLDSSGITASHNDGSQTLFGADGLYHREGGTDYETSYLNDVYTITGLNRQTDTPYWYQLPSIYKGKNFKAVAVVSDAYGSTADNAYYNLAMLRIVTFVHQDKIDYANARVPLVGYMYVRDIRNDFTARRQIQVQLFVSY